MSDKKCKSCCEDAKWEWGGDCYCEFCLRNEFEVWEQDVPRVCEMCGASINRIYYTDGEGTPFCTAKCAIEYNGACEIEKEQEKDESMERR